MTQKKSAVNNYGTKEWFEFQFSKAFEKGEDLWGHQWRASQKYRYNISLKAVKDKIFQKKAHKILDLGCGLGDFTNLVYSLNPSNMLFGMDISKNAIRAAKIRHPKISFKNGTLPEISFNEKFDGIIALECICYLDKQKRIEAFKNIKEYLIEKGWFLFSSPLDDGVKYFSEEEVINLLRKSSFKIEKITYNYAKLYTFFEKPFLKLISLANKLQHISSKEQTDVAILSKKEKFLLEISHVPVLRKLIKYFLTLSSEFSKFVLKSNWIVTFFQTMGRLCLKEKGRSHIIILCSRGTND